MIAAARYLKGCEMLEPYAVKVARTVLRRGGASNRFLLSLQHRNLVKICVISWLAKHVPLETSAVPFEHIKKSPGFGHRNTRYQRLHVISIEISRSTIFS